MTHLAALRRSCCQTPLLSAASIFQIWYYFFWPVMLMLEIQSRRTGGICKEVVKCTFDALEDGGGTGEQKSKCLASTEATCELQYTYSKSHSVIITPTIFFSTCRSRRASVVTPLWFCSKHLLLTHNSNPWIFPLMVSTPTTLWLSLHSSCLRKC